MSRLTDFWLLEKQWHETPKWLRWLGKPKYRAKIAPTWNGGSPEWIYSDTYPSYVGISREANVYWRTRKHGE